MQTEKEIIQILYLLNQQKKGSQFNQVIIMTGGNKLAIVT